ncbi:MAG: FAD/NAD(P)-binding protein [Candidatus Sumerlaeia bacterium]|nr:FAD/NAD(P)-binding protein [Candidatus Sumerlaeia bacterium]
MYDWIIVGGGVHGTHLALRLLNDAKISPDRLAVLDPAGRPLSRWNHCTRNVAMDYLRSTVVHHLDSDPLSLKKFGSNGKGPRKKEFLGTFQRPSYRLFQRHCDHVLESSGIERCYHRATALRIRRKGGYFSVETGEGDVTARHVLLALGLGDQLRFPEWARNAAALPVHHLFDQQFQTETFEPGQNPVIIGGGISATQLAISLAEKHRCRVTVVARHSPRAHEFDSDSCYMGPKCLNGFWRKTSLADRRDIIQQARKPGTIPRELHGRLRTLQSRDAIRWQVGEVSGVRQDQPGLELKDGQGLAASSVVLATGFETGRPGGPMIDMLVKDMGLKTARCGYPVVGRDLQWGGNLHVTGPLAELELGPVSRNILGARLAADRICRVAC